MSSDLPLDAAEHDTNIPVSQLPSKRQSHWKVISLLAVLVLLAPHTVSIERASLTDSSYEMLTWAAVLWVFSHTEGSSLAGPFSISALSFPGPIHLLWGGINTIVNMYVFHEVRRFASRPVLRTLGIRLTLAVLVLVWPYGAFFSYSLDAWMSALTLPFPVAAVMGSLVLYETYRRRQTSQ